MWDGVEGWRTTVTARSPCKGRAWSCTALNTCEEHLHPYGNRSDWVTAFVSNASVSQLHSAKGVSLWSKMNVDFRWSRHIHTLCTHTYTVLTMWVDAVLISLNLVIISLYICISNLVLYALNICNFYFFKKKLPVKTPKGISQAAAPTADQLLIFVPLFEIFICWCCHHSYAYAWRDLQSIHWAKKSNRWFMTTLQIWFSLSVHGFFPLAQAYLLHVNKLEAILSVRNNLFSNRNYW